MAVHTNFLEVKRDLIIILYLMKCIYGCFSRIQITITLGWPKSLFKFFCNMLWENLSKLFGHHNIYMLF